jgi:diguanylate cyclase (GGDEF)-like protein
MTTHHQRRGDYKPPALRMVTPSSWSIWSVPRHVATYIIVTDIAALSLTAILVITHHPTTHDIALMGLIIALGMANAEVSRHIERMRRRFADTPHVNLTSVWTIAAALVLSPGLASVVVVILYGHLWLRSWYRVRGVHAYRLVFSAATIILACHAVTAIRQAAGATALLTVTLPLALWALPLAILTFSVVNSGLVAGAIGLAERTLNPLRILGSWNENAIEYATLCLGVLTAALLEWKPVLVALFIPALHILHRSILVRQFEQAATSDAKTGLLNAMAWHALTDKEFDRVRREGGNLAVLMIDLDHFKRINDHHGHLTGDRVLQAVATELRAAVRRYDILGRFGGEEFVVALPDADQPEAVIIGERICDRIRKTRVPTDHHEQEFVANVSVSIGVATYPAAGTELDQVLLAADNAMFSAKNGGRNQVRATTFSNTPNTEVTFRPSQE